MSLITLENVIPGCRLGSARGQARNLLTPTRHKDLQLPGEKPGPIVPRHEPIPAVESDSKLTTSASRVLRATWLTGNHAAAATAYLGHGASPARHAALS